MHYIYMVYLPDKRFSFKKKEYTLLTPLLHKTTRKALQDNIQSPAIFGFDFKNKKLYQASLFSI